MTSRFPAIGKCVPALRMLCALVFGAVLLWGCGNDAASVNPAADARRALQLNTASAVVVPSAGAQSFTLAGVKVTVPGALLDASQTLAVKMRPDTDLDKPLAEMQTIGVYEITLGTQQTFDKPLVLEFAYDAASLGEGAADGKNLWVMYWDEARARWARTEAQVDAARQKIVVQTGHLSTWWVYRMRGYDYVPKVGYPAFEVWFNPAHVNPRTDVVGQSMKGLAEDVQAALVTARDSYQSAGFLMPAAKTSVFIADVKDSNYGALGGAIDLKRTDLIDLARIRGDSAHELFHAIQNQYYFTGLTPFGVGVGGMSARLWLTEGTPDFMAYEYAWGRAIPEQIASLQLDWFADSPFVNLTDVHAYSFGNFLRYASEVEHVNVKQLWDYVVTWWVNTPQAVRSGVALQTGKSFDTVWNGFVEDSLFGAKKLASGTGADIALDKNTTTGAKAFTLKASYTAKLVPVKASPCDGQSTRPVRLRSDTSFAGASGIQVWTAEVDASAPVYVGLLSVAGQELALALNDSNKAYALAFNNGASAVPVSITATAQDCSQNYGYSKTYPNLGLYNREVTGDVGFSMTGPFLTVNEYIGPGFVFLSFKVAPLTPGKTASYQLYGSVSGAKYQYSLDNPIMAGTYSWNNTSYGDGSGDTVSFTLDSTKCWATATFSFRLVGNTAIPTPINVDINGCP